MLPRSLLALLLLTSAAQAVQISYSDATFFTDGGAYVKVKNSPTTEIQRSLPSIVEFTGDIEAETLSIAKWDIYDDASDQVVYSLGAHTITDLVLTPFGIDERLIGSLTTPEGAWSVHFWRDQFSVSLWSLQLRPLTQWYVDKSVLTFQPTFKPFRVDFTRRMGDVPEPSGSAIAAFACVWLLGVVCLKTLRGPGR